MSGLILLPAVSVSIVLWAASLPHIHDAVVHGLPQTRGGGKHGEEDAGV